MVLLFSGLIACVASSAEPRYADSFGRAKREAMAALGERLVDRYCGCRFDAQSRLDPRTCGYQAQRQSVRAERIEWEHVVPAENMGRQRPCWREGGREHCEATDPAFRRAHNDLHNLLPVVGELNGDRSNYRYAEIPGEARAYGSCDFEVDAGARRAEPPEDVKGDVARISLYMRDMHGLQLAPAQVQLFQAWARQDPVDAWELERDRRIAAQQGNHNPYVHTGLAQGEAPLRLVPAHLPSLSGGNAGGSPVNCAQPKTCKAMRTCDEAVAYLRQCNLQALDRDGDGVPCERLCRHD